MLVAFGMTLLLDAADVLADEALAALAARLVPTAVPTTST